MSPEPTEQIEESQPSVGERLKAAREARGLSLRDVATSTRQSQDTLAALESMMTQGMAATIVRMQAKTYATFLDLPADEIASGFAESRGQTNASAMPDEVMRPAPIWTRPPVLLAAGVGLILVVGIAMFFLFSPSKKNETTDLAVSARLSPKVPTSRAVENLRPRQVSSELSIRALETSWIEVRGADGTVFRNRNMTAGEEYFPRMGAGWTVTVRDGGAFEWVLDETPIGLLGTDDMPAYALSVDVAAEAGKAAIGRALVNAESENGSNR